MKRRPKATRTRRTRRPREAPLINSDRQTTLDQFLNGTQEFQRAHIDGMKALRAGDTDAVADAIARERTIIQQQQAIIDAQKLTNITPPMSEKKAPMNEGTKKRKRRG